MCATHFLQPPKGWLGAVRCLLTVRSASSRLEPKMDLAWPLMLQVREQTRELCDAFVEQPTAVHAQEI